MDAKLFLCFKICFAAHHVFKPYADDLDQQVWVYSCAFYIVTSQSEFKTEKNVRMIRSTVKFMQFHSEY